MNNEKPRRRPRGLSFQSYDDLQQRQPEKHDQLNVLAPTPIRQKPPISLIDELQTNVLHAMPLNEDITSDNQPIAFNNKPITCDTEHSPAPIKTKPVEDTRLSIDKVQAAMSDAVTLIAVWFAQLSPGSKSAKKNPQTCALAKPNPTPAAATLKPLPLHLGSSVSDSSSTQCFISPQNSSLLTSETSVPIQNTVASAEPIRIIHNIGYCGPAVLGLQLYELIAQRVITLESHSGRYHDPIALVLRLFSTHYETVPLSTDDFINMLSGYDCDSIQWIMSPIMRLTLLCFLKSNELSCSSSLFNHFDNHCNFFKEHEKVQTSLAVSNECLGVCLNILHEENQRKYQELPPSPIESLRAHAYRKYPLSPDDLFLLCRIFSLKLDLHLNCVTDDTLKSTEMEINQQILNRLDMQDSYFTETNIKPFVTIQVVYEVFVFERQPIDGHFDAIFSDALLANRRRRYTTLPSPEEMDAQAQISHGDGESFLKNLIQQKQSYVTLDKNLAIPLSNPSLSTPIKRSSSTSSLSTAHKPETLSESDSSDDLVEICFDHGLSMFQPSTAEPTKTIHTDSAKIDLADEGDASRPQ